MKVIIGGPNGLAYIAAQYGNQINAWKGLGVDVKVIVGTSSTATTSLATGNADIGINAGEETAIAISKGLKAKIVAANDLPSSHYILVSKQYKAQHNTTNVAQLKDARWGSSNPGSSTNGDILQIAQHFGWSERSDRIVFLKTASAVEAAMKRGDVDALTWGVPIPFIAADHGIGTPLGPTKDYVPEAMNSVFAVSDAFATKHAAAVQAFFKGYFKAVQYYQTHVSAAIGIMKDWGVTSDAAKQSAEFLLPLLSKDGRIPAANMANNDATIKLLDKGAKVRTANYYTYWKDLQ